MLYTVTATVENVGEVDGEEVAQLYVEGIGGADGPRLQLRGFERLSIKKGESAKFRVDLTRRDLSTWDVGLQDWILQDGGRGLRVWVGRSSRKLELSGVLGG